jgi:hypothetical protein
MFPSFDIPSARYALCPLLIALPIRNWFNFPPPSYLLSFPTSAFRIPTSFNSFYSLCGFPSDLCPSNPQSEICNPQLIHSFATSFFPIFQILGLSVLITQSCFFPPSHPLIFSPSFFLTFSPSHLLIFFLFRLPHSDFRLPFPHIALILLKIYDWPWAADSLPVD